jgi:hypothetical protein
MRRCIPAIALGVLIVGPAAAFELPARKAGLWEIAMAAEGPQPMGQTMQQCIDAATDKALNDKFSGIQPDCSQRDVNRSGSTITIDSSCKIANRATHTHMVIEGDFDSAYTMKIATSIDGDPAKGQQAIKRDMTLKAKWLGPCKPDQKPGDIEMSNGMKMNILEMPGSATGHK